MRAWTSVTRLFHEMDIDWRTGIPHRTPAAIVRFNSFPYIGSRYGEESPRVLFVGQHDPGDKGYLVSFGERRQHFKDKPLARHNPRIAGTWFSGPVAVAGRVRLGVGRRHHAALSELAARTAAAARRANPLSFAGLTNWYRWVETGGGAVRRHLDRNAERAFLAEEIRCCEPEIVIFQGGLFLGESYLRLVRALASEFDVRVWPQSFAPGQQASRRPGENAVAVKGFATRLVGCQIRLYPNRRQAVLLGRSIEAGRELWNALLEATMAHQERTGKFLGRAEREQFVKRWKAEARVAADVPANALYRVARDAGQALANWQRRRKQGKTGGFPKYRSRYGRQTGIYQAGKSTHIEARRVWLAKVGWVRWRGGALPHGRLVSGRVWLDAGGRWTASLAYDCPPARMQPPRVAKAGLAAGRSPLATLYDGERFTTFSGPPDPASRVERRHERIDAMIDRTSMRCPSCGDTLARARWRGLRTDKQGKASCGHPLASYRPSARYERLAGRRAVAHRKMRLRRRDAAHKASTAVVRAAGTIHRESLESTIPGPAAREFIRQLEYKAKWQGRTVVVAPQTFRGAADQRGGRSQESAAAALYHFEPKEGAS